MSDPDDSSRLSETLERLLHGDPPSTSDDVARPAETFELPEIIPATADPTPTETPEPPPAAPTLPARSLRPSATPASPAAGSTRSSAASPSTPAGSSGAASKFITGPDAAPSAAAAPPPVAPAAAPPAAAAPTTTSWGDHVTPMSAGPQLRTPGRRPRVRRVTRVLRHIDPWSTFKIALLFSAVGYVVALTSGVLLWRVADSTGTLDNVERWFTQFGWETFELQGDEIFRNAWVIGLFGVVFATGGAVLLVTLFNLVSDIVGGIRMTVLEEEVVERTASSRRRYVVRSGADVAAATSPRSASWSVDDDGDDPDDDPVTTSPTDDPPARERDRADGASSSSDWSVD